MATQNDIFISHSSKDEKLAEKLVSILLTNGCDVSANQILCTSLEGMKIPPGTPSFIEFLRQEIQDPKLVILLLTENYFASSFCVCELGASWGMNLTTIPLLVPPMDSSMMKGTLKVTQAGSILDESYLDELRDMVKDQLDVSVKTARWNLKKAEFLELAPGIIKSLPKVSTADRAKLSEAEENFQEAVQELAEKDREIDVLKEQIEQLKKIKPPKDVREVMAEYSDEQEQFEELCDAVISTLNKVHRGTRVALYWETKGENYYPEDDEWDNVKAAAEIQEVIDPEDSSCFTNSDHPRVKKAEESLSALVSFLNEVKFDDTSLLVASFEEENEIPLDVGNREFWSVCLLPV